MNNSPKDSFLVTCVGAYNDSGQGTGGFVCVYKGEAYIIDKMDCTGLFYYDGLIFRYVRSLQNIIIYDNQGIRATLKPKNVNDVHDILFSNDEYVLVSTGNNSIYWHDRFGNVNNIWKATGDGDAWHLNCLFKTNGKLFASAFGEYYSHREWAENINKNGFIMDLHTKEKVMDNLSGPHSPRFIIDKWVVCESHIHSLSIQNSSNEVKKIKLNGFTRGLAYDSQYYYVGESINRKEKSHLNLSHIAIIDISTLKVVHRIRIPFPEIYEIISIPESVAKDILLNTDKFIFDIESKRLEALEKQVEISRQQIEYWKKKIINNKFLYSISLLKKNIKMLQKRI